MQNLHMGLFQVHFNFVSVSKHPTYRLWNDSWLVQVIEHKPYDCKADVFSFGTVLWELLTGEVLIDAIGM
jgi:hypothetical protein